MWFWDLVDGIESWLADQSFYVQAPLLLMVTIPVLYLAAGLIDRVVEWVLRPHARRESRLLYGHPSTYRRAASAPVNSEPGT